MFVPFRLSGALVKVTGLAIMLGVITLTSFWFVRTVAVRDSAQAQVGLDPDEMLARVDEDFEKPRFEGSLNGFTFYRPTVEISKLIVEQGSPECTGSNSREIPFDETSGSPLHFSVTYLPSGAALNYEMAHACGNDVVAITQDFGNEQTGLVQIARVSGPPYIETSAPLDRLTETTVRGRPAVVQKPIFPGGRMTVYLRDEISRWKVSGFQMSLEELLQVAEGVN